MRGDAKDILGGSLIVLFGVAAFYIGSGYNMGSAQHMGPGYFPLIISAVLVLLGLSIVVFALRRAGTIPRFRWRPAIASLGSVLAFALLIRSFGLVPAVFATVFVSAFGDQNWSAKRTFILAAALSLSLWILFSKLLGLSMQGFIWPIH
jgi:hypothetical protein